MEGERLSEQSHASGYITIAGRTDIAKVTFRDGTKMRFPLPSIASVTSARSIPTDPSPIGSRSSSQSRGRPKASSISSTSSMREQFGCFDMGDVNDESTDHTVTAESRLMCDVHSSRHNSDPLGYGSMGSEWGSTSTLRPGNDWTRAISDSLLPNQDQLVANAEGASQELPPQFEDMDEAIGELLMQDGMESYNAFVGAGASFGDFPGPSSAPPTTSWMSREYEQESASVPMSSFMPDTEDTFDVETVASNKPARRPGRIPGTKLPEKKRRKVAVMRIVGACVYCKKGRRGCDPGTPCKPCILHFGADVLKKENHCRCDIVETLTRQILSPQSKWHPYPREISDFFGQNYAVSVWSVDIPIHFGFGPNLRRQVHVLETRNPSSLRHSHEIYPPPGESSTPSTRHDFVLPVKFTDISDLDVAIEDHVGMLVDEHLQGFPSFNSRFKILHHIHKLFSHYCHTNHDYAHLLRQALKLLVLIHCSQISVPADDPTVMHILERYVPGYRQSQTISACILRAELGKIFPQLARKLLKDVLERLLQICLVRRCDQHPIVIATFSVLMMTIESVMYHSARIGYHANSFFGGSAQSKSTPGYSGAIQNPFASTTNTIETASVLQDIEKAAACLQLLYRNCFENCHALLLRMIDRRHFSSLQKQFGEVPAQFIAALNQAIRDASPYIEMRASEKADSIEDISRFFDRLISQLYLLQTAPA